MKKKKNSPFDKCSWFVCLRRQNKPKNISVCLSVWMYVRTWTFHVDTITFEEVSGSKQYLVGVFYVWNVGLVLKSKVISWSWSWSWFWTEFWFFSLGLGPHLSPKKISVCLSVWMYVRTWTFRVDTITFEGVSGSKQNLVGVFYV